MSQQIINVGSAPNDGTGDLLRVSQQKANANFTDLYNNKQDNLTAQNFGTFSNGLTTEDAIVDTDLINFTDVSDTNKQKKTTWSNLKAKLKTYFDAFYQVILVSGTNIKTINGTSILGGGNLVVSGGSSADYLYQNLKWNAFRLNTINTWTSATPNYERYDTQYPVSIFGTGIAPSLSFYLLSSWNSIPTGYIVDEIEIEVNFSGFSGASSLQVYIAKSEVNFSNTTNGVSNSTVLTNEIIPIPVYSNSLKFIKKLTLATDTLPALNKGIIQIAVREITAIDIYYSLGFNFKYKKI